MRSEAFGWKILRWLFILLFSACAIFPILVVILTSFKSPADTFTSTYKWTFLPTFQNYIKAFASGEFGRYFFNSVIITLFATSLSVGLGTLAAYGLERFEIRGSKQLSNIILLGKLVPSITILLPFFIILQRMQLVGTYAGPILAAIALNLPFVIWMMISFIQDIPKDLSAAAMIDGATQMQTFWKVILPILTPAIASAAVLSMQLSWNEYMFSLQLTNLETAPLTVGISKFVGAVSVDWGKSCAAATVTMLPIIAVGFVAQKYLTMGMTMGAVKE